MTKQLGSKNTNPHLQSLICNMAHSGIPTSQIALDLKCSQHTVQEILRRGKERGFYEDAPRSGRPSKLSDRAIRHLKINIEANRRQTLANITHDLNLSLPSPVAPSTVRRAMEVHENLSSHMAAKKPFLTHRQKRARMIWAKEHVKWGMVNWERVIWTDEASVEIGLESRACLVWRRPGERYDERCLAPTFKSGRQSLMVWGCITYGRRGPLIRIPKERRKGVDYVDLVLSGPLWDFYLEESEEKGAVLVMEDGAPTHKSHVARDFCSLHSMESISHPAQSPDLNPIEHVWKKLKTLVNQRPHLPRSLDDLWVALQEEWEKIDVDFINGLINSMPNRAQAVYRSRGGHTKY